MSSLGAEAFEALSFTLKGVKVLFFAARRLGLIIGCRAVGEETYKRGFSRAAGFRGLGLPSLEFRVHGDPFLQLLVIHQLVVYWYGFTAVV